VCQWGGEEYFSWPLSVALQPVCNSQRKEMLCDMFVPWRTKNPSIPQRNIEITLKHLSNVRQMMAGTITVHAVFFRHNDYVSLLYMVSQCHIQWFWSFLNSCCGFSEVNTNRKVSQNILEMNQCFYQSIWGDVPSFKIPSSMSSSSLKSMNASTCAKH